MNEFTLRKLEFDQVKQIVVSMTVSPAGRLLAERMAPSVRYGVINAWLQETEEAAGLLASGASIPLSAMDGIDVFLALLGKGKIYVEQELEQLAVWLASVAQMKRYMNGKRQLAPTIAAYADSMFDCPMLREQLGRCIRYGTLTDEASPELAYIRKNIYATEDKIQRRMEGAMSKYRSSLQENIVSKRNNRFVLSVKRELRKSVPGSVLDESSSGQTLFVEPLEVSGLQEELQQWRAAEERERTAVLARLSQLAEEHEADLSTNAQAMASFDFIIARAKFARSVGGNKAELKDESSLSLLGARHPLLGQSCEPLDIELGVRWKQLIITGPNTGGKTVALKTIGLLALMNQSGLLIPARPGSAIGIFHYVAADVGDGQSLEQSLSTFSSHISVMKDMLGHANSRSLLLLDELAAGTDPSEGIALSIAILEKLLERGAVVAATTHFNEIKKFAAQTTGCQNGRMAFDPATLKPLYRLEIGEAGDSQAFVIARRFGLPEIVVQRAEQLLMRKRGPQLAGEIHSYAEPQKAKGELEHNIQAKKLPGSGNETAASAKRVFRKGDSVWIYPLRRAGVVFRPADERGNVIVQVKGEKLAFNQKRLKLYIAKEKLYPGESYDLDIVFETKSDRKNRHTMSRKHVQGLEIVTPPPEAD